jgi:Cytochrome P450
VEIDTVIGRERVPTFADKPHLPYLQAVVKELLRWRPAGPLGIVFFIYNLLVSTLHKVYREGLLRSVTEVRWCTRKL